MYDRIVRHWGSGGKKPLKIPISRPAGVDDNHIESCFFLARGDTVLGVSQVGLKMRLYHYDT
jgi:hypothetical protein